MHMPLLRIARRASCVLVVVVAACGRATLAYDDVSVPSLEYHAMQFDAAIARKLQAYGVVTIKNVPDYTTLRNEYLRAAAECAWESRTEENARGILYRVLDDGTERLTIGSTDGVDALDSADCPAYQQSKQAFNDVVESAVLQFTAAFDGALAAPHGDSAPQSSKLHAIVAEAQQMDHFHAYIPSRRNHAAIKDSSAQALTGGGAHDDLDGTFALSMHSDSGLFIAMTSPAFFEARTTNNGSDSTWPALQEIANPDPASGLLIKLGNGTIVRPVQHADELTIMVGDGFSSWIQLPVRIPAVVHGMLMPQTCHDGPNPILRAWFGKMVLLSPTARMMNTGVAFAEYQRQLSSYVATKQEFPIHFASAACPGHPQQQHRRLTPDPVCEYRVCHPMTSKTRTQQCNSWCNTHNMDRNFDNQALCQENCVCSHHPVADNTYRCWMACFEYAEDCPREQQGCTSIPSSDGSKLAVHTCKTSSSSTDFIAAESMKVHVRIRMEGKQ
uniref:Uncharacterized protein n=1 Tax=Globisporangium ultimum (strain ATCC 200006 / CBS 805.95 / DAOM BR144) TaxID=431595 RepID=K3W6M3_GLOUD